MGSMDAVRRKIEKQQQQKAIGVKGYWQMKAIVREDIYPILLNEGDRTQADNPSEVVNRALALMQRLMDATGTLTFTEAVETVIYGSRNRSSDVDKNYSSNYGKNYPYPVIQESVSPLASGALKGDTSPDIGGNKPESESQFDQLMNS